jgi:hypothetical protein
LIFSFFVTQTSLGIIDIDEKNNANNNSFIDMLFVFAATGFILVFSFLAAGKFLFRSFFLVWHFFAAIAVGRRSRLVFTTTVFLLIAHGLLLFLD